MDRSGALKGVISGVQPGEAAAVARNEPFYRSVGTFAYGCPPFAVCPTVARRRPGRSVLPPSDVSHYYGRRADPLLMVCRAAGQPPS